MIHKTLRLGNKYKKLTLRHFVTKPMVSFLWGWYNNVP